VGRSGVTAVQGGVTAAGTGPQSGAVGLSGSNFVVNLPAALGATGGTSLAFILGRQATRVLDVQLTALERRGQGRLLANPRLTTPNHERAMIESGREIPYLTQQISGGILTNTVAFKKASIELEVTPHVIEADSPRSVSLDVIVTRREADFANAVQGNPSLITRTLLTRALVKEGETAVLGGLTTDDATETNTQVPFLGKIPVLGLLFRNSRVTEDKLQLMIFISPATLPTPLGGAEPVSSPSFRR
jgi:type IV pilus assembly protein PilQ